MNFGKMKFHTRSTWRANFNDYCTGHYDYCTGHYASSAFLRFA